VSKLVSPEGKILIPGVNDLIAPVTDDERKKFEEIHFKITDIQGAIGGDQTLSDDPVATLMGRMSKFLVDSSSGNLRHREPKSFAPRYRGCFL
jgi:hypothetical protein